MKITKEDIRDGILDKFEKKPYYEDVIKVFDVVSHAYFKLGFEFHVLLNS